MKRKFSSIFFYILTLVSIFGFNSCADHINEPVKEFFKEYTETAQVSRYELSQSPVMDSNGSQNVTSNQDLTIYYYLINPQQYTLNTQLKKAAEEGFSETRSITQSEDKYILSYYIPKADLKTMELAGGSFSPSLRLIEEFTRRDFGIYPIALKVNTPPPQVLSITFYKNSSNCYVIYFNLPGTNQTNSSKIHKDLNALKINGNTFPLSVGTDGIITFAEGSGVKPCTAIDTGHTAYITGLDFVPSKDASIAQSFYYVTDVQTKEKDSTVYSFTLTDRLGLSTVTNGSPTAEKLGNALIYCGADIVADGASLAVNSKNQTTIAVRPQAMAGSFVTSNATVNYIIERKEEGGDFTEVDYGSQNGGIEVTLTPGVYRITTTVSQSGLTTSDTTQTTFTVEKATLGTAQVLNNGVEVADNAELGVDSNKQAKITIKPQDKTGNVDTRNATVAYKIERLNKTDDGTEGYQEIANGSGSYTGSKDFTLETGTYRITTSVTMEGLLPSPEKTISILVSADKLGNPIITCNGQSVTDGAIIVTDDRNKATITIKPQDKLGKFDTINATVDYTLTKKEDDDFINSGYNTGGEKTLDPFQENGYGTYTLEVTLELEGFKTNTSTITFVINSLQVGAAVVTDANGNKIAADNTITAGIDGKAKINIAAPEKTEGHDTSDAEVSYKIEKKNDASDYDTITDGQGSLTGSKEFALEAGDYKITTSVTKDGFKPTEEKTVTFNVIWKEKVTVNATSIDDIKTAFNNGTDKDIEITTTQQTFEMGKDDFASLDIPSGSNVKITGLTFNISNSFTSATTSDNYSVINIPSGSSLTLENCTLTGTHFHDAGGTAITNNGELTIKNTTIKGFVSNGTGAGIKNTGTVTMESGSIESNKARYGAAVYQTSNSAVFNMQGGTITGNTKVNGSIIYGSGTFNWSGGEIKNNPANDIFGSNVTVNNTSGNTAS